MSAPAPRSSTRPGSIDIDQITTVVAAVGVPVNVLILPGGPSVAQLAEAGVRRISTGSLLTLISFGAMVAAAERLRDDGVVGTTSRSCRAACRRKRYTTDSVTSRSVAGARCRCRCR